MNSESQQVYLAIQKEHPTLFTRFFAAHVNSQFESPERTELQAVYEKYVLPSHDFDTFVLAVHDLIWPRHLQEALNDPRPSADTQTLLSFGPLEAPRIVPPPPPDTSAEDPFHVYRFLSHQKQHDRGYPLEFRSDAVVQDALEPRVSETRLHEETLRSLLDALQFLHRRYEYPLLHVHAP